MVFLALQERKIGVVVTEFPCFQEKSLATPPVVTVGAPSESFFLNLFTQNDWDTTVWNQFRGFTVNQLVEEHTDHRFLIPSLTIPFSGRGSCDALHRTYMVLAVGVPCAGAAGVPACV